MGAITLEKANSLFWLGRYIERVYTTTRYYSKLFDIMLDKDPNVYHTYCKQLDIADFYLNDAHFITSYLYDLDNIDSIYSNLKRAYDNAIVLRDEISSEVLSYIQMCINTFEKMEEVDAPIMMLQSVIDNIFAFWGSLVENCEDSTAKDIIKLGKYAERVDLYCRLDYSSNMIDKHYQKLCDRIQRLLKESEIKGLDMIKEETSDKLSIMNELIKLTTLF